MQIKTYEEAERQYIEQIELVKQLKAENADLQRDARTLSTLRTEVTELRAKVQPTKICSYNSTGNRDFIKARMRIFYVQTALEPNFVGTCQNSKSIKEPVCNLWCAVL